MSRPTGLAETVSKSRERETVAALHGCGRRPLERRFRPRARRRFRMARPAFERHPLPEAVPPLPSTHVGLIGPFHESSEDEVGARPVGRASIEQSRISFPQPERATRRVETSCESRVFPSEYSQFQRFHICGVRCGRFGNSCKSVFLALGSAAGEPALHCYARAFPAARGG